MCSCTDAQLTDMQRLAEARRANERMRSARARQEEEEKLEAIRAVKEFLRAEEERLRREMEAERRRRILRRWKKALEFANVTQRFWKLNAELQALSNMQSGSMAQRYEVEAELLEKERQDVKDTQSLRHLTELHYLANNSSAKISAAESRFLAEYTIRLAEEKRIEDQYIEELRQYWKGNPEGDYKVRDARDELRRVQDKEYSFWDEYRRQHLKAVREDEQRKMDALKVKQKVEVKADDRRAEIDGMEWRRKRYAEERWAMVVGTERLALLEEMKEREYTHRL